MNSPEIWDYLLAQSPKDSALMGGAVIDYWFGKDPKDFDIFYSYKPGQEIVIPPNWKMTDADFNDPVWIAKHDAWYLQGVDANNNNPISSVVEYLVDGTYLVQLIGVGYFNPAEHLKNFDHSLTLGRYTKHGMFIHRKTLQTVDDHVIEYVSKNQNEESKNRSFIRAQNKAIRYGGHWEFKGFA